MTIDLAELRNLPPDRKLQIITQLWNDLHESGLPDLAESEWEEIFRRDQDIQEHPEATLSLDDVLTRISRNPS
jgi:putative addiction module component (TIGR02574 family)